MPRTQRTRDRPTDRGVIRNNNEGIKSTYTLLSTLHLVLINDSWISWKEREFGGGCIQETFALLISRLEDATEYTSVRDQFFEKYVMLFFKLFDFIDYDNRIFEGQK